MYVNFASVIVLVHRSSFANPEISTSLFTVVSFQPPQQKDVVYNIQTESFFISNWNWHHS
jgi:hypothetical protein